MQGALVTFKFVIYQVDSSCQVIVNSTGDPECNGITTAQPTDRTEPPTYISPSTVPVSTIGGAVGGAVILLIIAFLIVSIFSCCWIRRKHTGQPKMENNK